MSQTQAPAPQLLELEDIQGVILRDARLPFGAYLFARVDVAAHGREFLRRVADDVTTAAGWWEPSPSTLNVGISYQGFLALGLPRESLESFSEEFRQGMAARAEVIGDTGLSGPAHWAGGLGTPDIHLMLYLTAQDEGILSRLLDDARKAQADLTGVAEVYRQDVWVPPDLREHFGFRDAIGGVVVEGAGEVVGGEVVDSAGGGAPRPGHGPPIKAGEFILGYPDQTATLPPMPQPDVLGRNGTYAALRKLHQNVAAFRAFITASGKTAEEQELVAAKMVGRWRSGAPLALAPERDDPELGADPMRNNAFAYGDDPSGLRVPQGAHIRRINPRDSLEDTIADVKRHRIVRRGMAYGPRLPEGVADDGVDRGAAFLIMGASIARQFEFIQRTWINDGDFVGLGSEKDPLVGANDGTGTFTIPKKPIRRRVKGLPRFVTTRGGEYFFIPGIRALRWIAEAGT
jgi:Dyp-type peroxidase family